VSDQQKKKSWWQRKRVPIFMFSLFGIAVWTTSTITGVPIFQTAKERAERVTNRILPVEKTGTKAARKLKQRLSNANLQLGSETFTRIFKQEAELEVWLREETKFKLLHTYPICKHSGFLGPKLKEGDKQAPEGFYSVTKKQLNPGSRHYRAFNLGFPNEYDRAHGRTGSALMVHGGCTSVGCYAMTDLGVAEIYRTVEAALNNGQKRVPVHVFPFKMNSTNMSKAPVGKWNPFWLNLKQGHDLFEANLVPPKVSVCGKQYAFQSKSPNCRAIAGW